jgi:hypothetical protein
MRMGGCNLNGGRGEGGTADSPIPRSPAPARVSGFGSVIRAVISVPVPSGWQSERTVARIRQVGPYRRTDRDEKRDNRLSDAAGLVS